jgi:hypothetical protein
MWGIMWGKSAKIGFYQTILIGNGGGGEIRTFLTHREMLL